MTDEAFIRRVKDPNPMLQELARQAVDVLEAKHDAGTFLSVTGVSRELGVPLEYVLDERERRVRERRPRL